MHTKHCRVSEPRLWGDKLNRPTLESEKVLLKEEEGREWRVHTLQTGAISTEKE